jgi:type IV secretory pathway VirD2 relaxase
VVVKARIVNMSSARARAAFLAHISYISRDGVQREGGKGELYDREGAVERKAVSQRLEEEPHHFRLILSPEDAQALDLSRYTRDVMAQLEEDLGRKVLWSAVNHYNTGHPHVHVVIRGLDAEGRPLYIPRRYLFHGLRMQAQRWVTQELGPRTDRDLEKARQKDIHQVRLTSLDRAIERQLWAEGVLCLKQVPRGPEGQIHRGHIQARLKTLEELGFAHYCSAHRWQLKEGWKEGLRALGMRNDILQQMHHHLKGQAQDYLVYRRPEELARPIEGKVIAKGVCDELYDRPFVLVASADGKAHWITCQSPESVQALRPGHMVSVSHQRMRWALPLDEDLVRVAHENGGLYLASHHARAMEGGLVPKVSREMIQRRLERLEHHRLIVREEAQGQTGWRIPPSLLETLRGREAMAPNRGVMAFRRLDPLPLSAQETHPGPTWLDGKMSLEGRAPFGFGVELAAALKKREAYLVSLGIDPRDPAKSDRLFELERAVVMQAEAKRAGYRAIEEPGPLRPMRGVLREKTLPSGQKVALIVDDRAREMAMVPWQKEWSSLLSQRIALSCGEGDRLRLTLLDRGRDRGLSR